MALPSITNNPVRFGKVTWIGLASMLDSLVDPDDYPDEAAIEGLIIFKPSSALVTYPTAEPKYTRILTNRQINLVDGAITEQGRKYIKLEANVLGANPAVLTWTATFVLAYNGVVVRIPDAKFTLTPDSQIDLTDYIDPGSGVTTYPGLSLTAIQSMIQNYANDFVSSSSLDAALQDAISDADLLDISTADNRYATTSQGAKADSAVQPAALSSGLAGKANTTHAHTPGDITALTEYIQDAVNDLIQAGANVTKSYDDAANTLTISATGGGGGGTDAEVVRDTIAGALVASTGINIVVDDPGDTITISVAGIPASAITTGTLPIARGGTGGTDAASARAALGAGTSSLTLGTTASTAAAGNDARLSDTRTPTDGSVTTAKVADGAIVRAKLGSDVVPATSGNVAVVLGNSVDVLQESPSANSRNSSWFNYCSILSMQQFCYGYNAGIAGNTTAQMLARFDTDVTPYAPKIVVVGGCENDSDPANSISVSTFASNMTAIAAKVRSIGAALVVRTGCPSGSSKSTPDARQIATDQMNAWLRQNASALGAIAVLDFYAVLVDPATGVYRTAYDSGDGIHPNDAGAYALGQYAADVLTPLLPFWTPMLPQDNFAAGNLFTNSLNLGALASNAPDGWYLANGVAGGTASLEPSDFGNWYTTRWATASTANWSCSQGLSVSGRDGHTILLTTRVKSNLTTGQLGSWELSADTSMYVRMTYNMAGKIPDGVLAVKAVVPASTTYLNFQAQVPSGAVGEVSIGQCALYDLTAIGAA